MWSLVFLHREQLFNFYFCFHSIHTLSIGFGMEGIRKSLKHSITYTAIENIMKFTTVVNVCTCYETDWGQIKNQLLFHLQFFYVKQSRSIFLHSFWIPVFICLRVYLEMVIFYNENKNVNYFLLIRRLWFRSVHIRCKSSF